MKAGILLIAAVLLAGCDDAPPPSTGPAQGAGPTTTAAAAAVSDGDLAVPADFEDEAEKGINSDNYKAELDLMYKEIEAE